MSPQLSTSLFSAPQPGSPHSTDSTVSAWTTSERKGLKAPAPLVHSSKVWYEDGTVVLQAGSTLFRTYKGVLSRECTVFADMFGMPQPTSDTLDSPTSPGGTEALRLSSPIHAPNGGTVAPDYQGVPLIELHDPAGDMELFLSSIHGWSSVQTTNTKLTFWESVGLTILCSKYGADVLLQWAIKPIQKIYVVTLNQYLLPKHNSSERNASHHITIINLARQYYLPQFLPVAFYLAATSMSLREVYQGHVLEAPHDSASPGEVPAHVRTKFNDPEDMLRCAEGKLRLATKFSPKWFVSTVVRQYSCNQCAEGGEPCNTRVHPQRISVNTLSGKGLGEMSMNWCPSLRNISDEYLRTTLGLCSSCREEISDRGEHRETRGVSDLDEYRTWVWENLHSIFDLQPQSKEAEEAKVA